MSGELTRMERKILDAISQDAGAFVPLGTIVSRAYGREDDYDAEITAVQHITQIRKKLGADAILTKRGAGYSATRRAE